jgi:hypothetical protein
MLIITPSPLRTPQMTWNSEVRRGLAATMASTRATVRIVRTDAEVETTRSGIDEASQGSLGPVTRAKAGHHAAAARCESYGCDPGTQPALESSNPSS